MNVSYGPILCVDGKNKGRIGYLDDFEEEKKAIVYWGDPLICTRYSIVPMEFCSDNISMKDIIKRIKNIENSVARKPENKAKAILLQELNFAEKLMYEKHIRARFNTRNGLKLFISYSSNDKAFANTLYADLCDLGHDPWLDEVNVYAGQNIPNEIEKALDASDYLLVLLSKASVESAWVNTEWISIFWDEVPQRKVKVIPILLEDCNVPRFLKIKKHVNFIEDYYVGMNDLLRSLL